MEFQDVNERSEINLSSPSSSSPLINETIKIRMRFCLLCVTNKIEKIPPNGYSFKEPRNATSTPAETTDCLLSSSAANVIEANNKESIFPRSINSNIGGDRRKQKTKSHGREEPSLVIAENLNLQIQ